MRGGVGRGRGGGAVVNHSNTDVMTPVAYVCEGAVGSYRNTDVMTPVAARELW